MDILLMVQASFYLAYKLRKRPETAWLGDLQETYALQIIQDIPADYWVHCCGAASC